ncbi:hypothetical protein CPAR01_01047 [Colletotrichum paranaense]|uniref:IBR domain-containing protein n=1 Tax=Colletotrichum paranaense TaxID=1914294 RepID=A0ABQ9T5M0_9PEZI|nr:uncharacterized protein CPAR01_01047 [Colletotrichum paranaense]KAK1547080.1 hypothetical protein CPAR01_01047 [Colletotrichum paranaense]
MDEEDLIEFDPEPIEEMKHLCLWEGCVCKRKRDSVQKDGVTTLLSATNSSSEHQAIASTPSLNNTQPDVQTTHNTTSPNGGQVVLPKKAAEKKEVATTKQYKRDPTVCLVGFHNHYLWETLYEAGHRCDVCKRMQTKHIHTCPRCPFKICWACRCDYGLTNKTAKELRRRRNRV